MVNAKLMPEDNTGKVLKMIEIVICIDSGRLGGNDKEQIVYKIVQFYFKNKKDVYFFIHNYTKLYAVM